ncbi:MAG TPA: hypothetical protein PLF13_05630 [candidate division Zixibacteria bacterium]|nr:hypothetical protein [candidate division Zixibacteria bacterium]
MDDRINIGNPAAIGSIGMGTNNYCLTIPLTDFFAQCLDSLLPKPPDPGISHSITVHIDSFAVWNTTTVMMDTAHIAYSVDIVDDSSGQAVRVRGRNSKESANAIQVVPDLIYGSLREIALEYLSGRTDPTRYYTYRHEFSTRSTAYSTKTTKSNNNDSTRKYRLSDRKTRLWLDYLHIEDDNNRTISAIIAFERRNAGGTGAIGIGGGFSYRCSHGKTDFDDNEVGVTLAVYDKIGLSENATRPGFIIRVAPIVGRRSGTDKEFYLGISGDFGIGFQFGETVHTHFGIGANTSTGNSVPWGTFGLYLGLGLRL